MWQVPVLFILIPCVMTPRHSETNVIFFDQFAFKRGSSLNRPMVRASWLVYCPHHREIMIPLHGPVGRYIVFFVKILLLSLLCWFFQRLMSDNVDSWCEWTNVQNLYLISVSKIICADCSVRIIKNCFSWITKVFHQASSLCLFF